MVSSLLVFMSRQILVIFMISYFTENEYFTQLWFLLLRVMTDHTWSHQLEPHFPIHVKSQLIHTT